jgi:thioredoxin reductase (NADPH)
MFDVMIIGAGPAGLSAALWCDELGLDTLVLEQDATIGGQLHSIFNAIENYPAARFENGAAFSDTLSTQIKDCDFDLWTEADIESVDLKAKKIALRSGEQLQSISIIIASGVRRRTLGIPGEEEFSGRGIIDSGTRDREQYAGRDVCVIGGGDAAVENALLLAEVCPTVTLVHRGKKLRARPEFAERLHTNHCITVFAESQVNRILGSNRVEAVEILRREGIKPFQLAVGGVLIRIGVTPNAELFTDQLALDGEGYIVTNGSHETEVTNVFAIGDVSNPLAPTIVGAAGAGATAAKVIAARLGNRQS